MFDIIGKRFWYFALTGVLLVVCIISLLTFGLQLGIEFGSGSEARVSFEQQLDKAELEAGLNELGYTSAIVQNVINEEGIYLIRLPEMEDPVEEEQALEEALLGKYGAFTEDIEFRVVSPEVSRDTIRVAAIAVAIAAVGILLYIAWAFRRMPHPFRYGTCAVVALIHDTVIALGVFSILGGIMGFEVNLMFITGILAVIGYSVNNTVVVFDRIRENITQDSRIEFTSIVNTSLVDTMSRSLNTSLTTLLVVFALLFFIGAAIQNFAVILLVGIIAGTYSSLFIAPSLLVIWQRGEWGRLIFMKPRASE